MSIIYQRKAAFAIITKPLEGSFLVADYALAAASQIDHTPLDIVVDEIYLWNRSANPWITMAMLAGARGYPGFCLLDPPGALDTGAMLSDTANHLKNCG